MNEIDRLQVIWGISIIIRDFYGSKDASELWYKDTSGTLKGLGFVASPYDPCVFNLPKKKTGKNLITIGLHVDDLLVSAVDDKLLD